MRTASTLARAAGTFGATLAVMGAATVAVSAATSACVRVVVRRRQAGRLVACAACDTAGSGRKTCAVCRGRRGLRWAPAGKKVISPSSYCLCPLCAGTGEQACWSCKGTGLVVGAAG
jgi:hypothetical protein